MSEVWKDVVGYEGRYQVSNLGRVASIGRYGIPEYRKILTSNWNSHGYIRANFYSEDGKVRSFMVHRLVAQAFCLITLRNCKWIIWMAINGTIQFLIWKWSLNL